MYVNKVNVFKDSTSNILLKSGEVKYDLFTQDVIEVNKSVDRPDDYYFPSDDIVFTIKVKNIGNKTIRNITISDTIDNSLEIKEEDSNISTTHGEYIIVNNIININNITLSPMEEAYIIIKCKVKETQEFNIINNK